VRRRRAHVRRAGPRRLHTFLLTPWLAAGAGIVAAAALAVDVPHAVLSYGPPTVQRPLCQVSSCQSAGAGIPATTHTGTKLRHATGPAGRGSTPAPAKPTSPPPAGTVVRYQIVLRSQHGFVAEITLPSGEPAGWSLQLSFPAAHVDQVTGARWRSAGNGHGGTASADTRSGSGHQPGQNGRTAPRGIDIQISATGMPSTPTGCVLDGVSCSFSG
jgi:hypothetical protein